MVDVKAVKAMLEERLAELQNRASEIENDLSSPGSSDWEDNATESEDDEVNARLESITQREIHEVRLALSMIESGRYGTCTACGKPIGAERMKALPYATTCMHCS